jgi:hypothetical protein
MVFYRRVPVDAIGPGGPDCVEIASDNVKYSIKKWVFGLFCVFP